MTYYEKNDVRAHEAYALTYLTIELKEELEYLNTLYNIIHLSYSVVDKVNFSCTLTRALIILIGRISDYLRPIKLLLEIGYPEQAGTLAASIFELAHTCLYFTHNDEALERWFKAGQTDQIKKVLGKNWYQIVEKNCKTELLKLYLHKNEYEFYTRLCWMKHALPAKQDFAYDSKDNLMKLDICPKTHEKAIKDSRLVIMAVSHEVEIAIMTLCVHLNHPELEDFLLSLKDIKERLDSKYQQIYKTKPPAKV